MTSILSVLFIVIFFFLYVRFMESRSIYFPDKAVLMTPDAYGFPYEDVYFTTEDGFRLNGWFVLGEKNAVKKKNVVLFFHGNAGNIGDRMERISLLRQTGLNVFIFDYRGYGRSEGIPTEEGIYKDGLAAYQYLQTRPDVDPDKIVLYGMSLGGVFAVDLAAKKKCAALISDSTFNKATEMVSKVMPFAPPIFIRSKFDSSGKIKNIPCPKLHIHSQIDEVVPYALGVKLFDAAADPKEFLEIPGGHNDSRLANVTYINGLTSFLKNLNLI